MIKELDNIDLINNLLKNFNTSIKEIGPFSHYVGYYLDNKIAGFLNYDLMYEKAEIDYIFVDNDYRRKHIASSLVDYLVKKCKDSNVENISLEVRKSNVNAISLYEKHGFTEVATRKGYYKGEDGILMVKEMK